MNLKDKTKGLPKIYLMNLQERPDRLEYMETQFEKHKIKDYEIFNTSTLTPYNFDEWKSKLIYDFDADVNPFFIKIYMGIFLSYFEIIEKWLSETNDPYMILMEDDYNLSMTEHWHFDWEYLMNNIPYDWDLIQLGYENIFRYPCYLHPTLETSGNGAWLMNRPYAHKLLRLHKRDGRLNIRQKDYPMCSRFMKTYECVGKEQINADGNRTHVFPWLQPNYAILKNGRNYSIPIWYVTPSMGRSRFKDARTHPIFKAVEDACLLWWTEKRDQYTLEDFFTYGKHNDLTFKFRDFRELIIP